MADLTRDLIWRGYSADTVFGIWELNLKRNRNRDAHEHTCGAFDWLSAK